MRYFYLLLCTLLSSFLFSQNPQLINYQGIARTSQGDPIINSTIGLKFEIVKGSPTGTPVFSEEQAVNTGSFGVFSTQIGNTKTAGIGTINWNSDIFFLRVSIDVNNKQSYTELGSQKIVYVPLAMHANSVPTSYTNNVLTIGTQSIALNTPTLNFLSPNTLSISGGNTVEIAPSLTFTNNILTVGPQSNTVTITTPSTTVTGSGAASVASLGVNSYTVHVDSVTVSSGSNVAVSGSYPNYTVSATPTLNLLGPNTLSISGGNTVTLAPTLSLTGNFLSVGSPTNFVAIPFPTVTGLGAATAGTVSILNYTVNVPQSTLTSSGGGVTITPIGTNSFAINVPSVNVTAGTGVNVQGPWPNYTISSTPMLNLLSPNSLSITNGNSVAIAPSLLYNNNVLQVGPATNTVSIPSSTTTIVGTGALSVTPLPGQNNYSLNVPFPQFVNGNNVLVTGAYPTYTVSSNPSLSLNTNTLGISNGNSVVLETYTVSGTSLSMTPGPNHTITANIPVTTITGTGVANVTTGTGQNFTVNVPAPTLTTAGNTITVTQGTASSSANLPLPTLTTLGPINNSLTAGNNTISLNTYTVASGSGLTMTGGPNYTINAAPASVTISGTGVASVAPPSGNSFVVNVPNPAVTSSGNTITVSQGTAVSSATIQPPTLTMSGTNNNSLTAGLNTVTLNSYTVGAGLTMSVGANSTYTIESTHKDPTIIGTGIASVTTLPGNNFTVNVDSPNFSNGGITQVTGAYPDYTVTTPAPQATLVGTGAAFVPTTTGMSFSVHVPETKVVSSNSSAVINSAGTNTFDVTIPAPVYNAATGQLVNGPHTTTITQTLTFTNNILTSGPASNSVIIPTNSLTGTGLAIVTPTTGNSFVVNVPLLTYTASTGALGSGTNIISIVPSVTLTNKVLTVGATSNTVDLSSISPWTQSATAVVLTNSTSNVGIGTSSPTEKLQIESTSAGAQISVVSPSTQISSIGLGNQGNHNIGKIMTTC